MVVLSEKWINTSSPTSFCLRVGKHKGLIAGTEFCRNTMIQRIFLEPSDCSSWSNWPCAAKIQNNVCLMVGKVQRDWCHPCSMSRAIPFGSRTRGIVSEAGIPIVWFPGTALSLFNWVFRCWKSWLSMSTFFALPFLILAFTFVWVEITAWTLFWLVSAKTFLPKSFIAFRKAFLCLFFLCITKHNILLTTIQGPVLVSSPRSALLLPLDSSLLFLLPLPFFFNYRHFERSGLPRILVVVPCPKTKFFVINVTLLTFYFIRGPLSKFIFQ